MSTETIPEPNIQAGQVLHSSLTAYSILELIGEGSFGKVAKCQDLRTGETVAVKVLKKDPDFVQDAEHEVSILETISELDPDSVNVVTFFEQFDFMGHTCLAFEMLEANFYDLFDQTNWEPLHLTQIRPIAQQLFVALAALKTLGILHTDIKPDNIMFVREQGEFFRVKLIDFGLAIPADQVQLGMVAQPTGFRAPEVSLGLPFTEAIDVWGVGCVLAFLYLAQNLFPVLCDYHEMRRIVELLGQPADLLLWAGGYTNHYFALEVTPEGANWRLQTPEEFTRQNRVREQELDTSSILPTSLDDMMDVFPLVHSGEREDTRAFVDLLKGLLHLDGAQRLAPHQALQQPFITMTHLSQDQNFGYYFSESKIQMSVCQNPGLVEDHPGRGPSPQPTEADDSVWQISGVVDSLSPGEATGGKTSGEEIPPASQRDEESCCQNGQNSDSIHGELSTSDSTCGEQATSDSTCGDISTDSPAVNEPSSGGLRKRLSRFFKRLKKRLIRSCCCLRSAED